MQGQEVPKPRTLVPKFAGRQEEKTFQRPSIINGCDNIRARCIREDNRGTFSDLALLYACCFGGCLG